MSSNTTEISATITGVEGGITSQRSCNVWMSDGNVILSSGDIVHRVHRSIMGENSLLLRRAFDKLELKNIDYVNPPVIELDVSPSSLSHYISARYNKDE